MKLYRVECHRESDFSSTNWTTELEKAKLDYDKQKDSWYDDEEEVYKDDAITLVAIDVPEEVFEEFEDDSTVLQEEVICIDPDDEDEDGYVSSYWKSKMKVDE